MSFSFDTAQRALTVVKEAENLTKDQKEILCFIDFFIDELHEESHRRNDELNRGKVAETANDIDILLKAQREGKSYREKWREINP